MNASIKADIASLSPAGRSLIDRHFSRNFGTSGFQKIDITVFNGERYGFSYSVGRLWKHIGISCASLLWITSPEVMRGTAVALKESAKGEAPHIWLRLRTTNRPISIDLTRLYDCVLGTDFAYADLGFWVPFESFVSISDSDTPRERDKIALICDRRPRGTEPHLLKIVLDTEHGSLRELSWIRYPDQVKARVLVADDFVEIDGIPTPRAITVTRPRENYTSRMMLHGCVYGIDVDDRLLDVEKFNSTYLDEFAASLQPKIVGSYLKSGA
jgi:hypothetical protein